MPQLLLGIHSSLSQRALNLLRRIVQSEDAEMVWEQGGGWWVDNHRVAGRDAFELIRAAAIHQQSEPGMERWVPNARGREFLVEAAAAGKERG